MNTNFRIGGLVVMLAIVVGSWYLTCVAGRFDEVTAGFYPLDPRHFDRLTVVTLGTGGAYEDHNRGGPCTAVALGAEIWLVDAGRGVAESLRHAQIKVAQPATVLLTSLLPENVVGLDDLLAASWLDGRRERIRLIGPPGTAALARHVEAAARPGLAAWSTGLEQDLGDPGFDVTEIADGWTDALGEVAVRAGALPGGPLPAYAYRFEWRGRVLVVGGTGFDDEALTEFARGAHTLVHEAAYVPTPEEAAEAGLAADPADLEREARMHTTLQRVGRLAMRAGIDTLVLVRLRPPPIYDSQVTWLVDDTFDGRVIVADDGDEIHP